MASTAISAQGSTLTIGAVAISNIKSYSGFDGEAGEIDTTNLDSTGKEYLIGLQDFGSFSCDWNNDYSDLGQIACRAAQASGAIQTFVLTLPNADTVTFSGLVKNAQSISGGVDATLDGSMSIKVTGAPVFA